MKITPELLNDTLNLIQLARETALARGNQDQAERLAPVANNLQTLVTSARQTKAPTAPAGILGQSDFQILLNALQAAPLNAAQSLASTERNHIVTSMASAGMPDLDIARHMGLTREEVRLILSVNQDRQPGNEVKK